MSHNAFQSEKLQTALDKLEGKAELITQNIDAISGEIKALEEKLQSLRLPIAAEAKVSESTKLTREEEDQTKIYPECPFKALEYLKWEKDKTTEKFRLLYHRVLESEDIPGLSIETMLRPLIECPLSVRLKMHTHLDKLVKAITDQISI